MKKSTFLKLAVMFVAMFIYTGAFAQTNGGLGVEGATAVTFTTGGTVTMVAGTTIPLYAKPDPIYHSTWDYATQTWTLTAGFIWNWSITTGNAAHFTFAPAASNTTDNYVALTALPAALGGYVVSVTEQAPVAYGGCAGAPTTQAITVVATPDAALTGAGTTVNFCTGDLGIPTAVEATITGGWQNYRLAWSLEIATLGAGLAKDEWFDTDKTTSLGGAAVNAEEYTAAVPQAVGAAGAHSIMSVASFTAIDPDGVGPLTAKPTVYTYTLTSINDQALRYGDYIGFGPSLYSAPAAADFSYNPIAETYTIQINPAPSTGPIYHIPTTWAN